MQEYKAALVVMSFISSIIWLAMGSRANTLAHAASIKVPTRAQVRAEDLRRELVKSAASGLTLAYEQCRNDFKWERWNCPEGDFSKRFNLPTTREMAYVAAITSAGISYSVARSCAKGDMLLDCKCVQSREDGKASWNSDECNADLRAGEMVAQVLLTALEGGAQDIKAQVNSHNYMIGRQAVEHGGGEECKCHGLSGSCTTRTCWGRVPHFPKIGKMLKEKYQRAHRIAVNRNSGPILSGHEGSMVFLEDSPDFCKPNITIDWPGTDGRVCSRRKESKMDRSERRSCKELCRSCGYRVQRRKIKTYWKCNCTFQWCCDVKCDTCSKTDFEVFCDGSTPLTRLY